LVLWAALLSLLQGRCVQGLRTGSRFILISSPSTSSIYYAVLPSIYEQTLPREDRVPVSASLLINGSASKCFGVFCDEDSDVGLQEPAGLAVFEGVHSRSARLYVADTKAQNIYAYDIVRLAWDTLVVGSQTKVLKGVNALGIAVDSVGNLLYTQEGGQVSVVTVEQLDACIYEAKEPKPAVLLGPDAKGAGGAALKAPAGIATDNFFLYLANSEGDASTGTVMKAPELLPKEKTASEEEVVTDASADAATPAPVAAPLAAVGVPAIQAIAANTDVSEAVAINLCLARDNVFFTGDTKALFAVKSRGGTIAQVTNSFKEPKGCVYDEESTLFVADQGDDAVFSLPANFVNLRAYNYTRKVYQVPGPSGVALLGTRSGLVIRSSSRSSVSSPLPALAAAAAAAALSSLLCRA